jgi:hypothetical protein
MATYEIVRDGAPDTVTDLPAPAEIGEVIFFEDNFWQVDAIEDAKSDTADGRLVVSFTTDAPPPAAS